MLKIAVITSALTAVALAQVPSGISTSCSTFLNSLNSDSTLAACTSSLASATSAYASGSGSATSSSVSGTLGTICSSTSMCSESALRSKLTEFYSACSAELTSSVNSDVVKIYDSLYVLYPFYKAACVKDDSGAYCATKSNSYVSDATNQVQKTLGSSTGLNADAFRSSNLPYLFLDSSLDSTKLCTSCTRNVITSYISFESSIAYAPGLAQSPILGGQTDLYKAITTTCGSSFLSGAVQAAGGISSGTLGNGVQMGTKGWSVSGLLGATGLVAFFLG